MPKPKLKREKIRRVGNPRIHWRHEIPAKKTVPATVRAFREALDELHNAQARVCKYYPDYAVPVDIRTVRDGAKVFLQVVWHGQPHSADRLQRMDARFERTAPGQLD